MIDHIKVTLQLDDKVITGTRMIIYDSGMSPRAIAELKSIEAERYRELMVKVTWEDEPR